MNCMKMGSTRVGKLILKQAAEKVQRVTMELSGHAPFIVFDDANIEKATDMAIASKFRNNGQVCISPSKFYIQDKMKKDFVNLFVEKTKKLKIGNGMDADVQLGPMTTKKRLNEIENLVEKIIINNLKNTFVKEYVFPMIRGHAIYEGVYLLGTSIARPLIAKDQIKVAKKQ